MWFLYNIIKEEKLMKKARKLFGVVLAIAMVFNVFAIAAVAENPVSQDVSNVSVNLQVGRYNDVT